MIQSAHRHVYSMIFLLAISFFASSRDLAFSGSKAASTSKVVFYVY
jgi:hypothetical protein